MQDFAQSLLRDSVLLGSANRNARPVRIWRESPANVDIRGTHGCCNLDLRAACVEEDEVCARVGVWEIELVEDRVPFVPLRRNDGASMADVRGIGKGC